MIKYSVISSVYKNIKTGDLISSLNSLKNQYLKPSEIVIIIDGYCKSQNLFIIKNFLKKYFKNKYKISYNKKNKGIPFSYNKAIKLTKHNFVGISDADDVSSYYRFYKQVSYLSNNKNLGLVGSYVGEVGQKKIFIKKVPLSNLKIYITSFFKNPINHPTVVFNKKIFFKNIKYKKCYRMEDYFLWVRALNKKIKFSNLPEKLVKTKVDKDFLVRRTGFKLIKSELKIQTYILKNNYYLVFFILLITIFKSIYHISSPKLKFYVRQIINKLI